MTICISCKGESEYGIEAECCPGWYCKWCWQGHRCNTLTDSKGKVVCVGDCLHHIDDKRIYRVVEIVPTYTKGQTCVGEKFLKRKYDGARHVLRTRLMEKIESDQ